AIVGRMKLLPYILFIFLWSTFCYDPLARWIFSDYGWLNQYGLLDFAGGIVVHLSSGVSGLVAALILGNRVDFDPNRLQVGHNLPFTVLGTGLLWVGWIGFNAGSALAANGTAALALINTNTSAASSLMIWVIIDMIRGKSINTVSIGGACSAIVVGLVVITPAAGYVQPGWALLMGIIGGASINIILLIKKRYFHLDDTLDVFACHGIGGAIGSLLTGLFCQQNINASDGALYGNPIQLWYQLLGILVAVGYASVCTITILLPMHFFIGIKIKRREQLRGLDHVAHGENWQIEVITNGNKKVKKPEQQPVEEPVLNNPSTYSNRVMIINR
ncbi:unnamed protein product, partial [Didymodactylos carnosus]